MVRCEPLTSLACTKPHWSCQAQGLMTVLSTTFPLSLARMLVPAFYVGLVSVRQDRATACPKVVELALFIQLPRIEILRTSPFGGFSEVRTHGVLRSSALSWCSEVFCAMAHIHSPKTGVGCPC